MKARTQRRIRDGIFHNVPFASLAWDKARIPILEKGLKRYSLDDLLDEVVERGEFWNHCAIGERFKVPEDNEKSAIGEMEAEGLTPHEANVLLEQGIEFMRLLKEARKSYKRIQRVRPTLVIPFREEEATSTTGNLELSNRESKNQ